MARYRAAHRHRLDVLSLRGAPTVVPVPIMSAARRVALFSWKVVRVPALLSSCLSEHARTVDLLVVHEIAKVMSSKVEITGCYALLFFRSHPVNRLDGGQANVRSSCRHAASICGAVRRPMCRTSVWNHANVRVYFRLHNIL